MNILADLFYCNTQQFFRIRADVIRLICLGIQHQENVIHIHGKLLKQLITVPDLHILSSEIFPVFLDNKTDKKGSNAKYNSSNKKHRSKLQIVHTGIDNISLDKSQKHPVLNIRFFIDQIIISSIQIQQHRISTSRFKLLQKDIDLFFRHIRMPTQKTEEIIHVPP